MTMPEYDQECTCDLCKSIRGKTRPLKQGATLSDNKSISTLAKQRDHILGQIATLNDKLYMISVEMLEIGG